MEESEKFLFPSRVTFEWGLHHIRECLASYLHHTASGYVLSNDVKRP
jgi:hypothetical protein